MFGVIRWQSSWPKRQVIGYIRYLHFRVSFLLSPSSLCSFPPSSLHPAAGTDRAKPPSSLPISTAPMFSPPLPPPSDLSHTLPYSAGARHISVPGVVSARNWNNTLPYKDRYSHLAWRPTAQCKSWQTPLKWYSKSHAFEQRPCREYVRSGQASVMLM